MIPVFETTPAQVEILWNPLSKWITRNYFSSLSPVFFCVRSELSRQILYNGHWKKHTEIVQNHQDIGDTSCLKPPRLR